MQNHSILAGLHALSLWEFGVNIEELRSFCAVVETGGFSEAARKLFLTQPAVSRHVRNLETSLGLALVDRSARPALPTAAGQQVYRHGLRLLEESAAIRSAVHAFKGLEQGRVVIGAGVIVGNYVLPKVVAEFHRQFPRVQVEVQARPSTEVFEQVAAGAVDFGLALGWQPPAELEVEDAYRDDLVLVASPDSPLKRGWRDLRPASALARVPLVVLRGASQSRRMYEAWLQQSGVEPRVMLEMDNYQQVKQVVTAGEGAAFMFRSSVSAELKTGSLETLDASGLPLAGTFVLVRRPRQQPSPAASQFLFVAGRALSASAAVSEVNTEAFFRIGSVRR